MYSPKVSADTLLLAGANDHYVPLHQLGHQMAALTGARSISSHVLTRFDHAQDHCHVGNVGLAIDLMTEWLDQMIALDAERADRPSEPTIAIMSS